MQNMSNIYLQLMNGNMYKSIATSEMDDNSPSQGNHALGNGNMNGTLQKLRDPDGNEIYKPQPVYDNTIQTRKLPDLPNTPESLGRSSWLLSTALISMECTGTSTLKLKNQMPCTIRRRYLCSI